jgi:hypothetical protein
MIAIVNITKATMGVKTPPIKKLLKAYEKPTTAAAISAPEIFPSPPRTEMINP